MGINLNEIQEKKLSQIKSTIKINLKNINQESNILTSGDFYDSPSNKIKNMKILTLSQNYNFTNKGNLLIRNSLNNKNNKNVNNNIIDNTNEEKVSKKSNKFIIKINKPIPDPDPDREIKNKPESEKTELKLDLELLQAKVQMPIEKEIIESGREKIIELLNNLDLKSKEKFKFIDLRSFVKKLL